MCVGNKAPQATFWVNKQVQALWELSKDCVDFVDKKGLGIKPSTAQVLLSTALAQLCVGRHPNLNKASKNDLDFYASFKAPELRFICNHEVIVTFKLKSGHVRATNKDKTLETFQEYHCSFRVPFKQHVIVDRTVDQATATKATFLVLDFKRATFVHETSGFKLDKLEYDEADRKRRAIVHNLTNEYLPLLTRAGFHFIQSLPDFDSLASTHHIDWSALASHELETHAVCGINVVAINTFLKGRWLEAAWRCEEFKGQENHSHGVFSALAEWELTSGQHSFHVFFAPPQIRALCSKEVVFYLDIPQIDVYDSSTTLKWSNWKIAIVVDVILVEEEDGMVQRLKLDFTNARYCENLSFFGKEVSHLDIHTLLVEYITTQYLSILTECHAHFIYYADLRLTGQEDTQGQCVLQKDPRDHLCITETFGFDFVTAVTQTSVNQHLHHLHGKLDILKRSHGDNFDCHFDSPRLQLSCDSDSDTVMLSLTLKSGWLKLESLGHEAYEFKNWRVTFEMKLKFEEYTTKDFADHDLGLDSYHEKHQLILDVEHAKFRPDLSYFPGLLDDLDFHLMRLKYIHVVRQLRDHYLPRWVKGNQQVKPHILYVLPSRKKGHSWEHDQFSVTCPRFQLYHVPAELTLNLSGNLQHVVNRGVIVICAMIDGHRRPSLPLPRPTWTWKFSDDPFYGTVVLSRSSFLDRWITDLNKINACSTLIPALTGIADSSDWRFKLVTLNQALNDSSGAFGWIKGRRYEWKGPISDADKLTFQHQNHDTWSYRHTGSRSQEHDGTCAMSCLTKNTMEIPTVFSKDGCKVKIRGSITLEMTFSSEQKEREWKTRAEAEWSSTITFATGRSGQALKVNVTAIRPTVSEKSGFSNNFSDIRANFKDATVLLNKEMREMEVDMTQNGFNKEAMQQSLGNRFNGSWHLLHSHSYPYTLRNPTFNPHGDLVLGLQADYNGKPVKRPSTASAKGTDAKVPKALNTIAPSTNSVEAPLASPNLRELHLGGKESGTETHARNGSVGKTPVASNGSASVPAGANGSAASNASAPKTPVVTSPKVPAAHNVAAAAGAGAKPA